jgi:hypothetical protein
MGSIDFAIPAIGGLLFLLMPLKATGDTEKDEKKKKMVRISGVLLLAVTVSYFCIKLAQGSWGAFIVQSRP